METSEHFYADDPAQGPPDCKTNLPGVDYFFVGNGLIQAAIQVCRSGAGTSLGLLIMHPGHLGPKRSALTFDSDAGLAPTVVSVRVGDAEHQPSGPGLEAGWAEVAGVPAVQVAWQHEGTEVQELFYCPDRTSARLIREVQVVTQPQGDTPIGLVTGPADARLEWAGMPGKDGSLRAIMEYAIQGSGGELRVDARWCADSPNTGATGSYWARLATVESSSPTLNHLFTAARNQLPAAIGASGTMDGSIWQYNREWVRDQSIVAGALTMLGADDIAGVMLERLLTEFVTDDGDTIDSSERRAVDDVELDQNGELLLALETHVNWTGNDSIVQKQWPRIHALAEFPLQEVFRHEPSGLLHNRREYWERHAAHGIEDGMELMSQFHVAAGLRSAAWLARRVRRAEAAERWEQEASRIEHATLHDERFRLVDGGRLIKRRGVDGAVQTEITAAADVNLPPEIMLLQDGPHYLNPDASAALPIATEFIDPRGELARRTLEDVEELWNQFWESGGYGRYNATSEADSPGPWPFSSLFVARAYFEAGQDEQVWRILNWLHDVGGKAGTWFEFYGSRPAPPYPQIGIPPWTWAEVVLFFVHHLLGVRPDAAGLVLRPRLLSGLDRAQARVHVHGHTVDLAVRRARPDEQAGFHVGETRHPATERGLRLPALRGDLAVEAVLAGG